MNAEQILSQADVDAAEARRSFSKGVAIMGKTMTPRDVKVELEAIDRRLKELEPWDQRLTAARNRYVLQDRRDVVALIEDGLRPGNGRPDDPDLEPFDRRWPGLRETQRTIANLHERRGLLEHQLPSDVKVSATKSDAQTQADTIAQHAQQLDEQTATFRTAVGDLAQLALDVAQGARSLWEENVALDTFCADADLARPDTPRREASRVAVAGPLGQLLAYYFIGGQPCAVDSDLRQAIEESHERLRAAPTEVK